MEYDSAKGCEPMDIDLSTNSANAMDISYEVDVIDGDCKNFDLGNTGPFDDGMNLLKRGIDIKEYDNKRVKMINKYIIVATILFAIISLVVIQVFNTKCKEELDLTTLKETLKSRIHGQETAIVKFIQGLEYKDDSKVLVLYGGTGVGKTFMVSLLLNNLMNFTNIYHYTMPVFVETLTTNLMHGLILCKSSMVIIDDIYNNEERFKTSIKKLLSKSKDLRKEMTLILIYNCKSGKNGLVKECDDNFQLDLEIKLKDIQVSKTFIKFEPLTEESLRKCIQNELKGRIISDRELVKIMNNFDVELDGCKGVHQKVKYYNIV